MSECLGEPGEVFFFKAFLFTVVLCLSDDSPLLSIHNKLFRLHRIDVFIPCRASHMKTSKSKQPKRQVCLRMDAGLWAQVQKESDKANRAKIEIIERALRAWFAVKH